MAEITIRLGGWGREDNELKLYQSPCRCEGLGAGSRHIQFWEGVKIQVGKVRKRRKDEAYPHSYSEVPEVMEPLLLSS